MIAALRPVSSEWIHKYIVAPHLEGAERMNRAWQGINFHILPKAPLSLKRRVWEWLTGFLISLPIIGGIIWIAWQTFGNPEKLSDPYFPKPTPPSYIENHQLQPTAASISETAAVQSNQEPISTQRLSFQEGRAGSMINADWEVKTFPKEIIATKTSRRGKWVSRYLLDGTLLQVDEERTDGDKSCLKRINSNHIHVKITKGTKVIDVTHEIKKPFVWIQQPEIGMKNFILSKSQEVNFCTVRCDTGDLLPLQAKKAESKTIDGLGETVKLEGNFHSSLPWYMKALNFVIRCDTWYDPKTGILKKFEAEWKPFGMFTINQNQIPELGSV